KDYAYIRTSEVIQSPELQLRDILSLNPPTELIIIKEQLSAWKENTLRPEFEKLQKLITAGKVATLYVWNLDRIYRNRQRLVDFLVLCRNFKVKVYSYNQKWLEHIHQMQEPWNGIMFDFMTQIIGWIAEDESTTKSNRVKMAINKTESGTLSYKGNKWGRKGLSKQTINRIMELHHAGKKVREIAEEVMVYDKANNGRKISKSAVHKTIVKNTPEKHSKKDCT
ncbi:MAG TPA: recombinase family protein, partial [Flavisolibacter sp.]|nr:recombinase family protein [Flavisolibacter sp.]